MQGRALLDGTKNYASFVVRAALFPLLWMWAWQVAGKHSDTDRNARNKVAAAIVLGVVFAAAGFMVLNDFQDGSRDAMYDGMNNRLALALGEAEYQDQVGQVVAKDGQIDILNRNLAAAEAAGEDENAAAFSESLDIAQAERAISLLKQAMLQRNHEFFVDLQPAIDGQSDSDAQAQIAAFLAGTDASMYEDSEIPAASAINFEPSLAQKRADRAFEIKDKAQGDMGLWMAWLLLPGLIGVLYAPLSIALGSILKNAWEPSDSVGFKHYPGGSMGLFLFLGAFGVPAIFFASWAFWDMDVRSTTGQISL